MTTKGTLTPNKEIEYPESDGQPMSDNTKQFNWIVTIKEGLEWLFAQNPNVFVAGDLLWYAVEGSVTTRQAPDAMVVFGRPKGDRGSYKQWEEDNIPPQVVFEVWSPGNDQPEMTRKREFYQQYGVQEYYEYDPDRGKLRGWLFQGNRFVAIQNMQGFVSPLLNVKFGLNGYDLEMIAPNGRKFVSALEVALQRDRAEARVKEVEALLEQERREKEQERQAREQAELNEAKLLALLKAHGIDPNAS
jgi:Uma2 family endonuclease